MPSRTFDKLNAISDFFTIPVSGRYGVTNNGVSTNVAASTIILESDPGEFGLTFSEVLTTGGFGISVIIFDNISGLDVQVSQGFTIDYEAGLGIPDNALITKITWRRPISVNYSAGFDTALFTNYRAILDPAFTLNTSSGADSFIYNDSVSGSLADLVVFEAATPGDRLSKADLISTWSSFINNVTVGFRAGCEEIPSNGSAAATVSYNNGWTVTVEYELDDAFQWSVSQDPSVPIQEGSAVTLKSPDNSELPEIDIDFEQITQVDIEIPDYSNPGTFITVNVPIGDWITIQPHFFQFIMPSWGGNFPTVVRVVLTSTQFSGTVARQLYTILFVSASGMYELVPGKTSDTLYIEEEPGETIDVKIPNPFGKTGFFGK